LAERGVPVPRSILVKLKKGNTLKRNVQWLKDRKQNEYEDTESDFEYGETEIENNEENTQSGNPKNETVIENDEENIETENENIQNENMANNAETDVKKTKKGRVIKKPNRYC